MDNANSPSEIDSAVCKRFWEERALLAQDPRSVRLETSPLWTVRLTLKLYQRWLLRRLPKAGTRLVVDLACGNGDWTEVFARRADRVLAVDFSEGMVAACRARLERVGVVERAELVCGDVSEVAIPPCDLVIAGAVTQYLGDERVDRLLDHIHAALSSDGLFYLRTTVSNTGATITKSDATFQGIYRPKRWFDDRLAAAGFETLATSTATEFVTDEATRMMFGPLRALIYYPALGVRKVLRSRAETDVAVYLLRKGASMRLRPSRPLASEVDVPDVAR